MEKVDEGMEDLVNELTNVIKNLWPKDILETLNSAEEVNNFVETKIETWNTIIDNNPLLSKEEKESAKKNFKKFKQQVDNNAILYEKYNSDAHDFINQILNELIDKKLLNKEAIESLDEIDIDFSLIWWNIVIKLDVEDMNVIFWKCFWWLMAPVCNVDWIPCAPIFTRKWTKDTDLIINHELQHFYNIYLLNYPDSIDGIIWSKLVDETIAQTLCWSYWDTATEWKIKLAQLYSSWVHDFKNKNYAFWNYIESQENATKIYLNQIILRYLDKVDVAWEMRDAWVENYADILATTPLEKRPELRDIYGLSKES